MTREIKFRAWHEYNKKMVYGPTDDNISPSWVLAMCSANNIEPMQYTGLKDKNGKEIYEGDILKVPDLYELPENTSMTYNNQVITFKNFSFQLGDDPLGEDYEYVSDECEVIGNIYDNPELLKEDEQ